MRRWWTHACLMLVAACGGTSAGLDLHFQAHANSWHDIVGRVSTTASATPQADLLFAVSATDPPTLFAFDSTQQLRWQSPTVADALIHTAGSAIVVVEDGALVAREASSGRRSFSHQLGGMSLLGVAREGETLAWVSATPSITATEPVSTIVVADARTGHVRWQRTISAALGAPLLRAGVLLVPWNRQGLTAIDIRDGHELARLHAEHLNVDWLDVAASGIIHGSEQIRDLACTDTNCEPLRSPFVTAPSRPALHASAYRAAVKSGIQTAYGVTRHADGTLSFEDGRAYLVFYRFVFAYDAAGTLVWLRTLSHDVLAAHTFSGGLALLDTEGSQTRLRASDGAWLARQASGGAWRAATFSGQPPALSDSERSAAAPTETRSSNLLSMVLDPDNRLLVARTYAVQELARDPQPEVTQQLLDAYEQRSTPTGLRTVLAEALRSRHTGSEHLIAALSRHYDFLDAVTPPPLSVVVPALVAMNERRAVPALMAHLEDPATAPEDLVVIAAALEELGDRSLSSLIVDWLRAYRSSTALASQPNVVIALARAARHLSAADTSAAFATIARQPNTHPVVLAAFNDAATLGEHATQVVSEASVADASTQAPAVLDQRAINAAFADRVDAIRACVIPEVAKNPGLSQVRIAFVARPNGSVHGFAFAPSGAAFASCMRPLVEDTYLFPFEGKPKVASYVIQLRSASPTQSVNQSNIDAATAEGGVAEWWSWYARETPPTDGAPWWSRYVERDLSWLPVATSVATPETPPVDAAPSPPTSQAASGDTWWLPPQP